MVPQVVVALAVEQDEPASAVTVESAEKIPVIQKVKKLLTDSQDTMDMKVEKGAKDETAMAVEMEASSLKWMAEVMPVHLR